MKYVAGLILACTIGFFIGWFSHTPKLSYEKPTIDTVWYKIDSIQLVIDTLEVIKTQTIYEYKEKENSILNNSSYEDYEYFSNFLRTRFPSNNYDYTTKAN